MVLALPALMPLPLLATVLDTLFASFQPPSIAMYPIPVLETVAAGVRAALVVDIGWAETVISSVYELREVKSWRSVRACKMMVQEMASLLGPMVSFEECQQQLTRMAWCRPRRQEDLVLIPTQTSTRQIPFDDLAKPCEETLLASGEPAAAFDDQELPIHHLIYRALQQLPISVRSSCMSRIIFTGGGANIPGVKTRLLEEVRAMLSAHGWDPVRGDAVQALKNKNHPQSDTSTAHSPSAAALATHPPDPIEAKLRAESTAKTRSAPEHGELSAIETLGAWSGASLLAQLKVASVSVVEREQWLAHGLGGASRSADVGLAPGTRLSMGPAVLKATERERTSWNLGVWA